MTDNTPDSEQTRREFMETTGGGILLATSTNRGDCGFLGGLLGNCDDGESTVANGDPVELLALISRAEHPTDDDIGEGNAALYVKDATLYAKAYGGNPKSLSGSDGVATHGSEDHDGSVPVDGTDTGYEIQKNGTDGSGVINFKT